MAALLILGPLLIWSFLDARCRRVTLKWWVAYGGIVLLVAGPWFVAISWSAPDATGTFFWLHNIVRFLAPFDHEKPAWFYLPGLIVGTLPWALLLLPLVPYLLRTSALGTPPAGRPWFLPRRVGLERNLLFPVGLQTHRLHPAGAAGPGSGSWNFSRVRLALEISSPRALALGTAVTAGLLLLAGLFLLPEYHRKFGLASTVCRKGTWAAT